MKLQIVFEIDTHPDIGLGDVAAVTQLAGVAFKRACSVLGECQMVKIKGAPLEKELAREILPKLNVSDRNVGSG